MTAARSRRKSAEIRGRRAEAIAALFLRAKGYAIVARRARTPVGEIDIVARRGRMLAFVEVKARWRFEDAADAIPPNARRRLAMAARAWLSQNPRHAGYDARFDALFIVPRRWPRHLTDAFSADSQW